MRECVRKDSAHLKAERYTEGLGGLKEDVNICWRLLIRTLK